MGQRCPACIGGEVPKKIINDQLEEAEEAVRWYKNLFGDDYSGKIVGYITIIIIAAGIIATGIIIIKKKVLTKIN